VIVTVASLCSYQTGHNAAKLKYEMQVNIFSSPTVTNPVSEKATETTAVEQNAVKVDPPADVKNNDTAGYSEYLTKGEEIFYETAKTFNPTTDKVTDHTYQIMYGRFLLPYYHQNPNMKFLEIGLGCNMGYGPGASVNVWKALFPKANLWEAEYDAKCVEKHRDGTLKGINVLTGDQGNDAVLDSWIETSGGNFDVVIDDGGHQNCQIWHSFLKLWPTVKPGGLYFIEDLQVGRKTGPRGYRKFKTDTCDKDLIAFEKLKEFGDMMIYDEQKEKAHASDIEFIFCQHEACVLGKKK